MNVVQSSQLVDRGGGSSLVPVVDGCGCGRARRVVDTGSGGEGAAHPDTPVHALARACPSVAHDRRAGPVNLTEMRPPHGVVAAVSVRDETVLVSRPVRRLATPMSRNERIHPVRAEHLDEQSLELLTEDDVDDKVDGRIESDQEIGGLYHLVDDVVLEVLEDVVYHGQQVTNDKDSDDTKQHGCQPDLLLLKP